jgi:hypothetical protein
MKTVWLAWWNNGLSYEDNYISLVGVFSTKEKAEKAGEEFHQKEAKYPWYREAEWSVEEVEIDKNVIS